MQTFLTPGPIAALIEIGSGDVHIEASNRPDTMVDVQPADIASASDRKAAERATIDLNSGRLAIRNTESGIRAWRTNGSVIVTVELPAGSTLAVRTGAGRIGIDGAIGDCRLVSGSGRIAFEQVGALKASTGSGDIIGGIIGGDADLSTGSGEVRVDSVEGRAVIKTASGDAAVGAAARDLRIKAASGSISVGHLAGATAVLKTASGNVRILDVVRGTVTVATATGNVHLGIHEGTAAWLELDAGVGLIRNELDGALAPTGDDVKATINARSATGDILVTRAS